MERRKEKVKRNKTDSARILNQYSLPWQDLNIYITVAKWTPENGFPDESSLNLTIIPPNWKMYV